VAAVVAVAVEMADAEEVIMEIVEEGVEVDEEDLGIVVVAVTAAVVVGVVQQYLRTFQAFTFTITSQANLDVQATRWNNPSSSHQDHGSRKQHYHWGEGGLGLPELESQANISRAARFRYQRSQSYIMGELFRDNPAF
jgi:hypothetical protein